MMMSAVFVNVPIVIANGQTPKVPTEMAHRLVADTAWLPTDWQVINLGISSSRADAVESWPRDMLGLYFPKTVRAQSALPRLRAMEQPLGAVAPGKFALT